MIILVLIATAVVAALAAGFVAGSVFAERQRRLAEPVKPFQWIGA